MKEKKISKRDSYWVACLEIDKELKEREEKLKKFNSCPLRDWLEVNAFKIYTTVKDLVGCLDYLERNFIRYSRDEKMFGLWCFASTTIYYKLLYKKYAKIYFGHLV